MLTGDKNIDTIILNKLEDNDLVNICKTSKYVDRVCKDQMFWLNRILSKYQLPLEMLNQYKGERSWSEYYINDLRRINYDTANEYLIDGAQHGRLDYVMISVKMGANIKNLSDELDWASYYGHNDVVKYLVSIGADIHFNDDEALRHASQRGHLDTVKYLVSIGSNIHANNDEAVTDASYYRHFDVVNYLTSMGAKDSN